MNIDLIKQKAGIVGESDAIHQVLEMVSQVANVDISVLINGESGTGKAVSYTHLTLPTSPHV